MQGFESSVDDLVKLVAQLLTARNWRMVTAESCTGGWIAKCCTDLPGSSAWFDRAFITYSNEAKQRMIGVDSTDLLRYGAVSEEIAAQMAEGARRSAGVNVAISTTGIAGPDGGTPEKPVGLVHFGWCVGEAAVSCDAVVFEGDRNAVRQQTVLHVLEGLASRLQIQASTLR